VAEKVLRLILGDQLNLRHSWFLRPDENTSFVMMEVRQETDYAHHHIQKIVAFFAAMRSFAKALETRGHRVTYLRLDDPGNSQSISKNISALVRRHRSGLTEGGYRLFAHGRWALPGRTRLRMTVAMNPHANAVTSPKSIMPRQG
jgi:deoxyribodipyrimidine photolyase-like uncharacterized protein